MALGEPAPLRTFLLRGVRRFAIGAMSLPGVHRIALVGFPTTQKANTKDADVLVTVAADCSLDQLARAGRSLKGHARTRNSGADIFIADPDLGYIGRICHWRECRPGIRLACRARHYGRR